MSKPTREQLAQTAREFYHLLESGQIDEWIELWAEEGAFRYPYASGLLPAAYEGKEKIYQNWSSQPDGFESTSFPIDEVIVDEASSKVVVRFTSNNVMKGGAGVYQNIYISRLAFNGAGKVVECLEYFNPVIISKTFGAADG